MKATDKWQTNGKPRTDKCLIHGSYVKSQRERERASLPAKSILKRKSKLARIPWRNIFPSAVMNFAVSHP